MFPKLELHYINHIHFHGLLFLNTPKIPKVCCTLNSADLYLLQQFLVYVSSPAALKWPLQTKKPKKTIYGQK